MVIISANQRMGWKTFLILGESLFGVQSLLFQVFLEAAELLNLQFDLPTTVTGTFVRVDVPSALKTGSQTGSNIKNINLWCRVQHEGKDLKQDQVQWDTETVL